MPLGLSGMSKPSFSVPRDLVLKIKDKYSLNIFVETGTYMGKSAEWASKHFDEVYTIEWLTEYWIKASSYLSLYPHIYCCLNDSRLVLPDIMEMIGECGTLFYLDAHWGLSARYGRPEVDSCALEEVLLINQWTNPHHAIVVDDADKFSGPHWPDKDALFLALCNNGQRAVMETQGAIVATPVEREKSIVESGHEGIYAATAYCFQ